MLYLYHVNTFSYLPLKSTLVVGRSEGDIILNDSALSGKHLEFTIENDPQVPTMQKIFVEDLNSKNHTALNRTELLPNHRVQLKINCFIEAGSQKFIVSDQDKLDIQSVNAILEPHLKKQRVKMENVQFIINLKDKILLEITQIMSQKNMTEQEISVKRSHLEEIKRQSINLNLEKEAKLKLLEEQKVQVVIETQKKHEDLKTVIFNHEEEIKQLIIKKEQIEEEIKQREKKAGALKINILD